MAGLIFFSLSEHRRKLKKKKKDDKKWHSQQTFHPVTVG